MSGFRKFRSTLHRRRRTLEAVELGLLAPPSLPEEGLPQTFLPTPVAKSARPDPEAKPLDFSPSAEAREIGPAPIAWIKSRRETDN